MNRHTHARTHAHTHTYTLAFNVNAAPATDYFIRLSAHIFPASTTQLSRTATHCSKVRRQKLCVNQNKKIIVFKKKTDQRRTEHNRDKSTVTQTRPSAFVHSAGATMEPHKRARVLNGKTIDNSS